MIGKGINEKGVEKYELARDEGTLNYFKSQKNYSYGNKKSDCFI